uniref:Serine/threonine-protein phosphatase 1 regulatory subunit 10 n=1 Tax=Cuerna arida TaxID=1464854 RepID=A0A1B6GBH7_9HEMI
MPRIDPQQLLKCLSVLLSPKGGIKSKDEVQRLASLMTKFSKKLVSKCIYVSILKATETDLLSMFMSAGGWDLTFSWLSDGVGAKNWPLVTELVDLLLICPVDIDRLKTNACPKLIKTLSKDTTADEKVRLLACKLVEQWLRIVRGDNDVSTPKVGEQAAGAPQQVSVSSSPVSSAGEPEHSEPPVSSGSVDGASDGHLPVYKITIRDGKQVLAEISGDRRSSSEVAEEDCSTGAEDVNQDEEEEDREEEQTSGETESVVNDNADDEDDEDLIKPVKLKKKPQTKAAKQNTKKPAKVHAKKDRESCDSNSSAKAAKLQNKLRDNVKSDGKKAKVDVAKSKTPPKSKIAPKVKENDTTKNSVVSKDTEESSSTKPKEKLSLSLKNKKTSLQTKEKLESKFDKKDKIKFDDDSLTEKEKETLSKFITPPISKLGKIPKKSSSNKEEKISEEKNRTLKDENIDVKPEIRKVVDLKKPDSKRPEKNYSISVEPKRSVQNDARPKTVKTYNSKFRSTGLEEEVKPPPPRLVPKKPLPSLSPLGLLEKSEKKLGKRTSPPPEVHIPEKKPKPESPVEEKKPVEKVGGIKLIPPKPKPMFLQESDVFMDAMLAANTMKEPRKRKRRASTSKDSGPSEAKKEAGGNNSPSHSPKAEDTSPSSIKPTFKFYQDTLDTSTEEDKTDIKMEDSESGDPSADDLGDDQKSMSSEDDKASIKTEGGNGPVKGVLVHLKTRRQKKTVSWKEDALECIKYFELDETERVNVTKNFADMKNMEREHERENLQIARKLAVDDIMEERTRWKALIPIDIAAPVVAPGKNSQEKDIQYAREKTVPAAVYFNKRTIPDSAAEPDLEIHATTDPAIIPLDDITGTTDSINDFTSTPWPEPKGQPPTPTPPPPPAAQAPPVFPSGPAPGPPVPGPAPFPPGPFPPMGPFMPGPAPPGMPMAAAGDCWRGADGKVVPMPPEMFPPQGMMPPPGMQPMGPGPMMLPPGVTPDMPFPMGIPGPNPSPEEMAHFGGGGFPPMGPSPPHQMFNPPPPPPIPQGPQGGNFQGSGGNWQNSAGGSWYDNEQLPHNPGSGRYQGNNNSWRGGRNNRNPDNWGGGGGGGNNRTPICNNFLKRGFCRNNNCRFRHPR